MPVKIQKINGGYRVSTPNGVHAKHTTKTNAMKQSRLLNAVEHGWKPTGKPARESQELINAQAKQLIENLLGDEDGVDEHPENHEFNPGGKPRQLTLGDDDFDINQAGGSIDQSEPIPGEEKTVEHDDTDGLYKVYGADSGFCYSTHTTEDCATIDSKKPHEEGAEIPMGCTSCGYEHPSGDVENIAGESEPELDKM